MALAGVVLIPVLIWFLKQRLTRNLLLFAFLFIVVFARGTLELLGIPFSIIRILLELLVIWIFIKGIFLYKSSANKKFPGLTWLILFLAVSLLSVVLNQLSFLNLFLFFRDFLMIVLFYYGVLNIPLSWNEQHVLKKLIIFLFIAQIGANIIKYFIFQDIIEPYIGTMANFGGSLTVIFALIGGSYTLALYFSTRRNFFLLYTIGFILFSLLGGKRATVVYFPIIFLFLAVCYQVYFENVKSRGAKQLILFIVLSFGLVYSSVRLMPSLNKERKVGGSFDIEYALSYSERYLTTGAGAVKQVGRTEAPAYVFNLLYSDNSYNFLLGYGAGHLVKSSLNKEIEKTGSQDDLTKSLYGVGYGARTAFLQLLLQVGILGLAVYLFWLLSIFLFSKKQLVFAMHHNGSPKNFLFFVSLWLVLVIDFFTYSVTMVQVSGVALVLFWFMAQYSPSKHPHL